MVAQFCPFCGQPIHNATATFCASCGQTFPWSGATSAASSTQPSSPPIDSASYGYVPPTLIFADAPPQPTPQPTPQPAPQPKVQPAQFLPSPVYTPIYAAPASGRASYAVRQVAAVRQQAPTTPGRLVGVAILFGVLTLIVGYLAPVVYGFYYYFFGLGIFSGFALPGFLYALGLLQSLNKSAGRVLVGVLAGGLVYLGVSLSLDWIWGSVYLSEYFNGSYLLEYGGIRGAISVLILGLLCWGAVSLAGSWSRARRMGARGAPAGAYWGIFLLAFAPLALSRFVAIPYFMYLYAGIAESLIFIILGSVVVWRQVK